MKYSKFDIDSWVRKEHYNIFKNYAQNAFSITAEIEITKLLSWVKENQYKFYPAMIHKVATVFNRHPEFRMAVKDNDLIVYESINPSYTIPHTQQKSFSSIWSEHQHDILDFIQEYNQDLSLYGDDLSYFPKGELPENIFYISALPWISFTSFSMQFSSLQNLFTPIVTIGKYFSKDNKTFVPIAIQLHHAVCDGFHAGVFFNELQKLCDELS
ncbi:CatA-like O-acetyltransferase [Wohlfahrtiimonas populi]|uniref:CatA-like O-acetyltransferase n=1 Tax=Wohlfahrtiimonas populi TaxID=1940240 RepID=UPI00098D08A2|nr:CatA-like O-acetyltransferase [Wohlfahrtiimonas populi]